MGRSGELSGNTGQLPLVRRFSSMLPYSHALKGNQHNGRKARPLLTSRLYMRHYGDVQAMTSPILKPAISAVTIVRVSIVQPPTLYPVFAEWGNGKLRKVA